MSEQPTPPVTITVDTGEGEPRVVEVLPGQMFAYVPGVEGHPRVQSELERAAFRVARMAEELGAGASTAFEGSAGLAQRGALVALPPQERGTEKPDKEGRAAPEA